MLLQRRKSYKISLEFFKNIQNIINTNALETLITSSLFRMSSSNFLYFFSGSYTVNIRLKQATVSWYLPAAGIYNVLIKKIFFNHCISLHVKFSVVITEDILQGFKTTADLSTFLLSSATKT